MTKRLCALLLTFCLFPLRTALGAPETMTTDLSSAAGVHWQFQPENGDWKEIQVPAGGWRAQGYTCDAGTYRATIPIPASAAGKTVRVAFAAVNFGADVFAGPDDAHLTEVASHVDGWVPFNADVTSLAIPGHPLMLVVNVKGRRKFMVNGKYIVPEGATWDPYLEEGILRGVHLEILPPIHVEDVFVQTSVDTKTLQPQVTIANDTNQAQTVTLAAGLSSWNKAAYHYPHIPPVRTTLAARSTRTISLGRIPWTLGPHSYWWPNVPYVPGYRAQLHLLDVSLAVGGVVVHHYRQRFGFRQFEARGNHYYLNGIICNLRGDNQQEADFGTDGYGIRPGFGPPSPGSPGWPKAVDNLLRLNFNEMRIHQIPATPYMLDVCDERGLMLIEESPLRGSEGGEDFQDGKTYMENMDRELVLRDRNHPATVIWSAANEWGEPIKDCVPVIQAVDDTRPIIDDGGGDLGYPYINTEHYVDGGGLPQDGAHPRTDRPYGEGEAVWPHDDTRQGFAWMAIGTRLRRLKGDADIRNYVLNNAWSNYVPGEGPDNEVLEIKVKGDKNATIQPPLADPWHDPNIRLMQQCYNPVAVCDLAFDQANKRSDKNGDWPVIHPRLDPASSVTRTLAVFNDEFSGTSVQVSWALHTSSPAGPVLQSGRTTLHIPLGTFATLPITFQTPKTPGDVYLSLASAKNGRTRFTDTNIGFRVAPASASLLPDGDYLLINANSGLAAAPGTYQGQPAIVQQPVGAPGTVWHLTNLGGGDVRLTHAGDGLVIGVTGRSQDDGALPVAETAATGDKSQLWKITTLDDMNDILTNEASGKLFDAYASATAPGTRIVQWTANNGANQEWEIKRP